jgi:DNA-binding response OmpR family regulator
MSENIKILLVDDDEILSEMLKQFLVAEGCVVDIANDGEEAFRKTQTNVFDIMILDIMMPKLNGIDTLKRLRIDNSLPVIMLTARGDDLDRILGLELGADDYMPKPCNPRELLARIRAVLRRNRLPTQNSVETLRDNDLEVNPANRGVIVGKETDLECAVSLTQTEFDILYLLISNPDQLISKSRLSIEVLEKPLSQWDRSIDVHISNLRKKLSVNSHPFERIQTLRGSGYLYQSQVSKS